MPKALSKVQRDQATALLADKTPHLMVSSTVGCSLQQVRKMSSNLRHFGNVVADKVPVQGRPRTITQAMLEVYIFTHFFVTADQRD